MEIKRNFYPEKMSRHLCCQSYQSNPPLLCRILVRITNMCVANTHSCAMKNCYILWGLSWTNLTITFLLSHTHYWMCPWRKNFKTHAPLEYVSFILKINKLSFFLRVKLLEAKSVLGADVIGNVIHRINDNVLTFSSHISFMFKIYFYILRL